MNREEILAAKAKRAELIAQAAALTDAAQAEERELTEEEATSFDSLIEQSDQLKAGIEKAEIANTRRARIAAAQADIAAPAGRQVPALQPAGAVPSDLRVAPLTVLPANVRRYGRIRNFVGANQAEKEIKAYRFGMWVLACNGHGNAQRFCRDYGISLTPVKATGQVENINTQGGYLVPPEFDNEIIALMELYGVFRKNARITPMISDVKNRPRRTGGLTAYFVGEAGAGTEDDKTWDNVALIAKKIITLTKYSNELNEDAVLSIGDDLIKEIGLAFATKEDLCGFIGDGTSTYGGIQGVVPLVTAATASLITGAASSEDTWSLITLANFSEMVGLLPQYADTIDARWYCHKVFFATVMQTLMYAAGGATVDMLAGPTGKQFLGYPVEVTQTMDSVGVAGVAKVVCVLANLPMAADLGDRRMTTIAFSESATIGSTNVFETDQIAIRGTERFDINVHDVGNTTAAGPVVGLLTKVT